MEANVQPVQQKDCSSGLERQKKRLRENCKEFESVMISYMMKSMRDSILRGQEPGSEMQMYEDMLGVQVSKEISHGSSLGIGDLLYSKLEPLVKSQDQRDVELAVAKAQTVMPQL